MQVKIKRVDKKLPLPTYDKDAVCFDLPVRETTKIQSGAIGFVPVNAVIEVPKGYGLMIFSRSSTPRKKGLILANGVGVIDPFYRGDKDEIIAIFLNITKSAVVAKKGEHLVQGMFIKKNHVEWNEVESMDSVGRGGYKSGVLVRKGKKK